MTTPKSSLSDTELEVLKALWSIKHATVRELAQVLEDQGRQWAYTTVQTLLHRLQTKGYVTADKAGLAHVFTPVVTRDLLLKQQLGSLIDRVCEGTATPLVMALMGEQRLTKKDIAKLRRFLDENVDSQ
jgi:BlaI family transcriptional regulator, penicillinase repressor